MLWCIAQLGYNMMLAPYVATMSDRVPDKVRGTVSGFYGAGIAVGQTLGSYLLRQGTNGIFAGWMMGFAVFSLVGIFIVVVWPRERPNLDEARSDVNARTIVRNFIPPRHAPDFYYALVDRTLMMGGYWMINTYQLYIAQDYILAGEPDATDRAAQIIATMAMITLVVSLIAAVTAGPITDRLNMRKLPVALASCLFAVGAAMPLIFRSPAGMYLFAGVAGLGYGVYNAIDQALNVAVLPNPKEAGKDLGILNKAHKREILRTGSPCGGFSGKQRSPTLRDIKFRHIVGYRRSCKSSKPPCSAILRRARLVVYPADDISQRTRAINAASRRRRRRSSGSPARH
ncbi:sucrose symporter [Bifidobacterium cuniculi]|uniref:Sucrose symporter n=1 Tax=Bifidobacterium cuniculi TaxID=1688 RepID=A0A087B3B4_9BIFI|nr:sucrose symporter [Bifidobacterium cuniculi]